MKKTLLVGALSGLFATMAHAQSSVTLYGLIDAGITYSNNQGGHSNWQETSGAVNGSRWGLRGAEDLGGGLKAIFTLENGFNINTGTLGQGSREFGRQAFVGLASNQYGSVTLGRQYDSVVDYLGPLALTGTGYGGTYAAHPFDNDNLDNSIRINNSVKYQSVNYAGFKFSGLYGFSNGAGEFANNRAYSFGASYTYGGLNVAAGYLQLNNVVNGAAITNTAGVLGATSDAPLTAGRQQVFGAGVNYTFGPATAGFVYTQTNLTQFEGIGAETHALTNAGVVGNQGHFQNFELNGRYLLTPALSLAGGYTFTQANFGSGVQPKWGQFSLQTAYSLSKRTDVYLLGEYQHLMNDANGSFTAEVNGLAASSNGNQVTVTAGLRHRF